MRAELLSTGELPLDPAPAMPGVEWSCTFSPASPPSRRFAIFGVSKAEAESFLARCGHDARPFLRNLASPVSLGVGRDGSRSKLYGFYDLRNPCCVAYELRPDGSARRKTYEIYPSFEWSSAIAATHPLLRESLSKLDIHWAARSNVRTIYVMHRDGDDLGASGIDFGFALEWEAILAGSPPTRMNFCRALLEAADLPDQESMVASFNSEYRLTTFAGLRFRDDRVACQIYAHRSGAAIVDGVLRDVTRWMSRPLAVWYRLADTPEVTFRLRYVRYEKELITGTPPWTLEHDATTSASTLELARAVATAVTSDVDPSRLLHIVRRIRTSRRVASAGIY